MKKATLFDLLGYPEQKELEYQASVNIVCFAVDELTKRAEKQNLSIF